MKSSDARPSRRTKSSVLLLPTHHQIVATMVGLLLVIPNHHFGCGWCLATTKSSASASRTTITQSRGTALSAEALSRKNNVAVKDASSVLLRRTLQADDNDYTLDDAGDGVDDGGDDAGFDDGDDDPMGPASLSGHDDKLEGDDGGDDGGDDMGDSTLEDNRTKGGNTNVTVSATSNTTGTAAGYNEAGIGSTIPNATLVVGDVTNGTTSSIPISQHAPSAQNATTSAQTESSYTNSTSPTTSTASKAVDDEETTGGVPTPQEPMITPVRPAPAPTRRPVPAAVVPRATSKPQYQPRDDDPLETQQDDVVQKQWKDKDQSYFDRAKQSASEMVHDRNVAIASAVLGTVGFVLLLFTAQQLMEHPDGCWSSVCRCCIGSWRIVCWPCRKLCGCVDNTRKRRAGHSVIHSRGDDDGYGGYSHDLELT